MRRLASMLGCLALCACAASPPPATTTPVSAAPTPENPVLQAERDPRRLPLDAQFSELVAASQALGRKRGNSGGACLLARSSEGFWLEAELMSAIEPIPDAPEDLWQRSEGAGPFQLLSRWGAIGDPEAPLALLALSATSPFHRDASLLIVSSQGTRLRHSNHPSARPEALDDGALGAALAQDSAELLYVTATAETELVRLHAVLSLLPAGREVALALALPAQTLLPKPLPRASGDHLCPDGLPAPAEDAPEGELPRAALVAAIDPLREAAQHCLAQARGAAAAGGALVLALRIGEAGRPSHSCLLQDEIGDPILGACVTESARSVLFPKPQPAGFVDVHLPLRLQPEWPPPVPATCR